MGMNVWHDLNFDLWFDIFKKLKRNEQNNIILQYLFAQVIFYYILIYYDGLDFYVYDTVILIRRYHKKTISFIKNKKLFIIFPHNVFKHCPTGSWA